MRTDLSALEPGKHQNFVYLAKSVLLPSCEILLASQCSHEDHKAKLYSISCSLLGWLLHQSTLPLTNRVEASANGQDGNEGWRRVK